MKPTMIATTDGLYQLNSQGLYEPLEPRERYPHPGLIIIGLCLGGWAVFGWAVFGWLAYCIWQAVQAL